MCEFFLYLSRKLEKVETIDLTLSFGISSCVSLFSIDWIRLFIKDSDVLNVFQLSLKLPCKASKIELTKIGFSLMPAPILSLR